MMQRDSRRIRFVAAWEIVGGLWALGLLILSRPTVESDLEMGFFALIACIAVASVVAGVALLRGLAFGHAASMAVQAAQTVHLAIGLLRYRIVLGPFATLGWSTDLRVRFLMGATIEAHLGLHEAPPYGVAVNLVAVVWLLMLVQVEDHRPAVTVFPDALVALPQLAAHDLGVITNGNHDQHLLKLERTGLAAFFRVVVVSEDCGAAKPDRRIFLEACRIANVAPADVIYVGDSWATGVAGRRNAGLRSIWLRRNGADATASPAQTLVIRSLDELPRVVESLVPPA